MHLTQHPRDVNVITSLGCWVHFYSQTKMGVLMVIASVRGCIWPNTQGMWMLSHPLGVGPTSTPRRRWVCLWWLQVSTPRRRWCAYGDCKCPKMKLLLPARLSTHIIQYITPSKHFLTKCFRYRFRSMVLVCICRVFSILHGPMLMFKLLKWNHPNLFVCFCYCIFFACLFDDNSPLSLKPFLKKT